MRSGWACLFGLGLAVLGGCASVADHLAADRVVDACRQASGEALLSSSSEAELEQVRGYLAAHTEVRLALLSDEETLALLGEPLTGARLARVRWEAPDASTLHLSLRLPPDHLMQVSVGSALLRRALPPLARPEPPVAPLGPASEPPPPPDPPAQSRPRRAAGLADALVGLITLPAELAKGLVVGLVEVLIVLPIDIASRLLSGRPVQSPYGLHRALGGSLGGTEAKPWYDDALLDEEAWRAEVDRREAGYHEAVARHEAKVRARAARLDELDAQMRSACEAGACTRLVVLPLGLERLSFSLDARLGDGDGACFLDDVPVEIPVPPPDTSAASSRPVSTAPAPHAWLDSVYVDEDQAVPSFADGAPPLPDAARVFRALGPLSPAPTDDVRVLCRVRLTPAYRRLAEGRPDLDVRLAWGGARVHGATLEGGRGARSFFVASPTLRLGTGDQLKLTLGLRRGDGHTYLGAQMRRFEGSWPLSFATKSFVAECRASLHADVLAADARSKRKGRLAALDRAVQALRDAVEAGEPGLEGQGFPEAAVAAVQDAAYAAAGVATWSDPRVVDALAARSTSRDRWEERAAERRRAAFASVGPLAASLPLSGGGRVEAVRSLCDDPRTARTAIDFAVDDKRAFAERCLVLVVLRAGAAGPVETALFQHAPVTLYGEDGRRRAARVELVATEDQQRWTDFAARAAPGQRLLALVRADDEDPTAPVVRIAGTYVRPAPFDPIGLDVGTVLGFLDGTARIADAPADLGVAKVRSAWRLCGLPNTLKGELGTFFTDDDFRYTDCVSAVRVTVGASKLPFDRLSGLAGLVVVDEGGRVLRESVVVLRRVPPDNGRRELTWEEGVLDPAEEAVLILPSAAPRYVRAGSVEPGARLFVPFVEHTLDEPTLDALR